MSVFRRGHVADDVLAIFPWTTKVSMLPRNVTLASPAADLLHQLAGRRCGNFDSPLSPGPGTQAPFELLCFRNHEERAVPAIEVWRVVIIISRSLCAWDLVRTTGVMENCISCERGSCGSQRRLHVKVVGGLLQSGTTWKISLWSARHHRTSCASR